MSTGPSGARPGAIHDTVILAGIVACDVLFLVAFARMPSPR